MKFTKMQGLGNDYVYVNCVEKKLEHASETAVRVSDRHFGIRFGRIDSDQFVRYGRF